MSHVISQIEAQKALISEIIISNLTDHQTESFYNFSNKVVKLAIFEAIMYTWPHDPSFGSIYNADFYEHILITKKPLRNEKKTWNPYYFLDFLK